MLKSILDMNLKFARLFSVLILLKILMLVSACGQKNHKTQKVTLNPPEFSIVNGCQYRIDLSPARGLNPDGQMDKYLAYLCGPNVLSGPYVYCSIDEEYCFNSTDRYFDVSL